MEMISGTVRLYAKEYKNYFCFSQSETMFRLALGQILNIFNTITFFKKLLQLSCFHYSQIVLLKALLTFKHAFI